MDALNLFTVLLRTKTERLTLLMITGLLTLTIFSIKGSAAVPFKSSTFLGPFHLRLFSTCNTEAIVEWKLQEFNPATTVSSSLIKCELTYSIVGQSQAQIVNIFLDPTSHMFNIKNLSQGSNYSVFLVCENSGKSTEINFISGSLCKNEQQPFTNEQLSTNETMKTSDTESDNQLSYAHTTGYDSVEWPITITFAAAGLIICAVVAFYMWKKYQRRQRILRIFRQGQNDPFQALYSPTQDSYSF